MAALDNLEFAAGEIATIDRNTVDGAVDLQRTQSHPESQPDVEHLVGQRGIERPTSANLVGLDEVGSD